MRKGGNEVRLSYSDFGAFEGSAIYKEIETNNAKLKEKAKKVIGKEADKEGIYFTQGVKDLAAKVNVGDKMTFKGKTFAFMKTRKDDDETREFVDGTVKLDVDNTATGKLNLNFGDALDLNVNGLDLRQNEFHSFNGPVTVKGTKVKGYGNVGATNLNLNMYGPEETKPTEIVGKYEFDFKKSGCMSDCDGVYLKGAFGAKKE